MVGISQSQMHNVLKGVRKLTPELADRVMACFDMSALDLLKVEELTEQISIRTVVGHRQTQRTLEAPGSHVPPARLRTVSHKS